MPMDHRRVRTSIGPIRAVFRSVPSKSVTHRALVAAALARGSSVLQDPLDAEDTRHTRAGLEAIGFRVTEDGSRWRVDGGGGRVCGGGDLFLGASGTSMRLLLAVAALGERPTRLDGDARLRARPLRELADALVGLGGRLVVRGDAGGLPVDVGGCPIRGGSVRIPAGRSSQFASAMLLIGARLPGGLDLSLDPPVVSLPYVELTSRVLERFGVSIERIEPLRWRIAPHDYEGISMRIEGDHSAASYFLAAAAIVGGRVRIEGLDPESAQADARLGGILAEAGCVVSHGADWIEVEGTGTLPPFDLDLGGAPDLVPTLAVLGMFSHGRTVLRGVGHLRVKESDRLEALARNLRRLGCPASEIGDRLEIGPADHGRLRGGLLDTSSDHRIAMAFAIAGLRIPGVVIDDRGCVAKSFPSFWTEFERLERS